MLTLRDFFSTNVHRWYFTDFHCPPPIFFTVGIFQHFPRFKEIARERSSNGHFKDYQAGLLSWCELSLKSFAKVESLRSPKYIPRCLWKGSGINWHLFLIGILYSLLTTFERFQLILKCRRSRISLGSQLELFFSSHALKKSESWIGRSELDGMFLGKKSCGETRNGTSEVNFWGTIFREKSGPGW